MNRPTNHSMHRGAAPLQSQVRARVQESPESSRRDLITIAALAAGGAAVASALPAFGQTSTRPAAAPAAKAPNAAEVEDRTNDIGVLNFALGLEYLEADFYSRAVAADGRRQFLRGRLREAATTLRDQELAHVAALTDAISKLGGSPNARGTYRFPEAAFISPIVFGQHAAAIEAIGVGAYLGAVSLIRDRNLRRSAAAIYGSESRHVAIIRHLTGFNFSPRYYEGPLDPGQVQRLIAQYVAA